MQCKQCKTEMFKHTYDEVDVDGDVEVKMIFKCPNPQCVNYGYKEEVKKAKAVQETKSN